MAESSLHILQTYQKPKLLPHPIYSTNGEVITMDHRIRLCPYYFINEEIKEVQLRGVLATLCPADKKIIHGMKDAALLPCREVIGG